ncbi:MAG: aminotransferase class I/II-fold pyridoxal phosphate-dependent enzyme [Micrococcaceae bacterium]
MDSLSRPYPTGLWKSAAESAGLLRQGVPAPTVFEEMTSLAARHNAVNLGQGFPDTDGPEWIRQRAADLVMCPGTTNANQYALGTGLPELRRAVSDHQQRHYSIDYSPEDQVLITTGATEGIAAAILALVEPGDDVITFEPFYDSYAAMIALRGATQVVVPLNAPDFLPDPSALEAAITPRTSMIVVNTPHNPTGAVLTAQLRDAILGIARRHDLWVLSDEVYEHLVYDGAHLPLAAGTAAPNGSRDVRHKVVTVSSAGKAFSLTGWKIGWVLGAPETIAAIRAVKQFLTYSSGPAYQHAIAYALRDGDSFLGEQRDRYRRRRDELVAGLKHAGLDPVTPESGYFAVVDLAPWGHDDAVAAARWLAESVGVVGIPVTALCRPGLVNAPLRSWMRFAFCKQASVIATARKALATAVR